MSHIFRAKQDDNPSDLHSNVSRQVFELRRKVDELTEILISARTATTTTTATSAPPYHVSEQAREFVRTILKIRAQRRQIFGADLFGEATWDMLLELYDAEYTGKKVSVSSLCLASGVPQTTALRWIGVLQSEGQIERVPDPKDGRRYFLKLTPNAKNALDRIFASLKFPE